MTTSDSDIMIGILPEPTLYITQLREPLSGYSSLLQKLQLPYFSICKFKVP